MYIKNELMGTIAHQAKNAVHNHCTPPKKKKNYKNVKGQNPYLNPKVTLSLNKTSTMPVFVVLDVKVESVG